VFISLASADAKGSSNSCAAQLPGRRHRTDRTSARTKAQLPRRLSGAGAPRQGTGDPAQQVTASIAQATQALGEIAKALQGNQVRISVATHAGYPDADQAKKLTGSRGTRPATRRHRAIRRWTRRSALRSDARQRGRLVPADHSGLARGRAPRALPRRAERLPQLRRRLAPRWDAGIGLLGRTDVVHLIGGGYLNALWPRHIGLVAGAAAAARRSGACTAMTGQGLVPFPPRATALFPSLADESDVVDARDDPSAELLNRGASTCDDVFLELPAPAAGREAREVVLCVQSDIGTTPPDLLAARLVDVLRAWEVDPRRLTVVEGIPRVDRTVPALLESELDGAEFLPFREVWRHGLPVAPGQSWISSRYHMHLLAGRRRRDTAPPAQPAGTGFPPHVLRHCRARKRAVAEAVYGTRSAMGVEPAPVSPARRLLTPARRSQEHDRQANT